MTQSNNICNFKDLPFFNIFGFPENNYKDKFVHVIDLVNIEVIVFSIKKIEIRSPFVIL